MVTESKPIVNGYYEGLVSETPQSESLKHNVRVWMEDTVRTMYKEHSEGMSFLLSEEASRCFDLYSSGRSSTHWLKAMAHHIVTKYLEESNA